MGGNWIHGGTHLNPLFTLAHQHQLLGPLPPITDWSSGLFFTSDGEPVDEKVGRKAFEAFAVLQEDLEDCKGFSPGLSAQNLMETKWVALGKFSPKDEEQGFFNSLINDLRVHHGDDLRLVNAGVTNSYERLPGGDVIIPSGYTSLVEAIRRQLPANRLLLETPVKCVQWSQKGVEVKCSNGVAIRAKSAVSTVSLGVLKSQASTIFQPPLPPEKASAIQRLGFGRVAKIFLEFPEALWNPGYGSVKLAWSKKELLEGSGDDPRQWYKAIGSFMEVRDNSRVIMAWLAGPQVEVMEQLEDEEVMTTCFQLLRKFSGDPYIPEPIAIRRSSWCSNPFFRGTYSYTSMECKNPDEDRLVLSSPLPDDDNVVLMFAGEATDTRFFSTAHGAYLSGIREANRIGRSLSKANNAKYVAIKSAAAKLPSNAI